MEKFGEWILPTGRMHVAGLQGNSGVIPRVDLYQILGGILMPRQGLRIYSAAAKSHQMPLILKCG